MKQKYLTADNVLIFLFISTVFLLAFNKIHDSDSWMHLSLGRLIWDLKGLPETEPFVFPNFTKPFGYTSWLFAVLIYVAFLAKGATGVVLLQAITVTSAFIFLLLDSFRPKKCCTASVIVLSMAVLVAMHRFVTRPEIFLMLFLAMTIYILNSLLYDNNKIGIYFLPLILLVWANTHSSVNLIFVPIGSFVIGSYIQRLLNNKGISNAQFLSHKQIIFLLVIFAISLPISLLNPNGITQYIAGADFMGADYYKQKIVELLPPVGNLRIKLIILNSLIALSFLLIRKNISIIHILVVIPFLLMPFKANRFFYLAVIVGGPIVARNIAFFCMNHKSVRDCAQSRIVLVSSALAIIAFATLYVKDKEPPFALLNEFGSVPFGTGFDDSYMPAGAVAFMDHEGIHGRVFNTYSHGQYIIWTGFPKRQVFIDARGGLPRRLLEMNDHDRINNQIIDKLYREYKFDSLLFRANTIVDNDPITKKIDFAFKHPEWALVHWDDNSLLYLNRQGPYAHIAKKYEYKSINPDMTIISFTNNLGDVSNRKSIEHELLRNIDETGSEKAKLLLAILYYKSKRYEKAIDILEKILTGDSNLMYKGNAIAILGDIYFSINDFAKCLYYYEQIPKNEEIPVIQYIIGKIKYLKGDTRRAIMHFEQALKVDKTAIQVYNDLITAYKVDGQTEKAMTAQQAYDTLAAEQTARTHFERGVVAHQKKDLASATEEYLKSLAENPSAPVVWSNLGFVYIDNGQLDEAYRSFMKALTLQADFANAHYGLANIYYKRNITDKAIEHFKRYCELEPTGFFYREAREQIQALANQQPL